MSHSVYQGDCLDVIAEMPDGSCDLIYLDPPFGTQKRHSLITRFSNKKFSFDDLWDSKSEYGQFLYERVKQFHRVLSEKGSIFFHCDRTATHIARAVLDTVFGEEMFRSEIIWFYRRWSNAKRGLLPQHQTIFWYSKTDAYTFNQIYEPYSPSTNVEQLLQQRERDERGKAVYARDNAGNVVPSGPKKGVPIGDVWDIPYLNPKASERVGYPTQKPILLLERIIQIATCSTDTVLDPFCGSGTTLVAATLLGRKAIGIDVSNDAVSLTRERLKTPKKTHSQLLTNGRESYDQADEGTAALLHGLRAVPVQRNKGIDAIIPCENENRNALVRIQRENEPLHLAISALRQASSGKNASHLIVIATQPVPKDFLAPKDFHIVQAPSATIQALLATESNINRDVLAVGVTRRRISKSVEEQLSLLDESTKGV